MRILFLSPRLCLPLLTGARIREYYLARALASRAEVTYVSFMQPDFPTPPASDLSFFHEVHLVPLPGRYSFSKIARGLVDSRPLSVLNYTTPEMKATVRALGQGREFDLVHVESCQMAGYVTLLEALWGHPARAVHNWHNIESEVMYRYAGTSNSMPRKMYARLTARRLKRLEDWILRTGFGHTVCSQRERAFAGQRAGDTVHSDRKRRRHRTICSGRRDRSTPAAGFCRDHGLPCQHSGRYLVYPPDLATRQGTFPGVAIDAGGGNPRPSVLELRNEPRVEVTGTVPDVRPYYRDAVASIVPLQTGGGTRLKILEAMASGVPVVSTTLGAEGLTVTPGKNIDIVDDEAGWVTALEALNGQERLWKDRAAAGLELVRASYDWEMLGERLYEAYRVWLEDLAANERG